MHTAKLIYTDVSIGGITEAKFYSDTEALVRQKAFEFVKIMGCKNHQFWITAEKEPELDEIS